MAYLLFILGAIVFNVVVVAQWVDGDYELWKALLDNEMRRLKEQRSTVEPPRPRPTVLQTKLKMPGVRPQYNESYLCTAFSMDSDQMHFLVGFEPLANSHQVHHILLYGCEEPGSDEPAWDCGEMSSKSGRYSRSPICKTSPNILYAWALDAPKLELPKGVGFRVGAGTNNGFLILQVHYMHKTDKKDFSGLRVSSTTLPQPRTAATLLMATDGQIPPKNTEKLEVACVLDEPVEIHPFAFRVHTHRHGKKVGGWLVEENPVTGVDKWTLLGERDPQLPQLFQPTVNQSLVVSQGDILASRCIIENDEKRVIKIGPTGEDEMCNFYLMYWVEGDRVLEQNTCFSSGSPNYRWASSAALNHTPK